MKNGMWCSHAAGPRIWWEVRHWWYNNISGPLPAAWRASPFGQVVHKVRSHSDLLLAWHRALDQINGLARAGKELRKDKELLREALEIAYEGQQDKLELLLAEAEAMLRKRADSEPF
tara:strand:+ start:1539 stop:1889 length:351 start_codon:yes stop_codon:yes gene_type:complete